jgi:phospholipid/cholesterol/gamma-HCH transport system ATP-binding protein
MEPIISCLGYDAAQEIIHSMGVYLDKHFGAVGGFSTRRKSNEFVTMLPFSDIAETENILNNFISDFQKQGVRDIWNVVKNHSSSGQCVDIEILAGIAQGQTGVEIDSIIELAKSQQKEIGRLRCTVEE